MLYGKMSPKERQRAQRRDRNEERNALLAQKRNQPKSGIDYQKQLQNRLTAQQIAEAVALLEEDRQRFVRKEAEGRYKGIGGFGTF